jgi:hypothetical protein
MEEVLMALTRTEFMKRWLWCHASGEAFRVRIRIEHTHPDSCYTEIWEGVVGAVSVGENLSVCLGSKGYNGKGSPWLRVFEPEWQGVLQSHRVMTVEEIPASIN